MNRTRFDAIIDRAFEMHSGGVELYGIAAPSSLPYLLAGSSPLFLSQFVHLLLVPNDTVAQDLRSDFRFFNPKRDVHILDGLDVSPYSGLLPNRKSSSDRISWLSAALHANPGDLFIATVSGAAQLTLPKRSLMERQLSYSKGAEISRKELAKWLALGYHEVPQVEDVGQFSMRGGILDVFSPASENPVRIELFGDQIESLRTFDPETQRSLAEVTSLLICPALEALFNDEYRQTLASRYSANLTERAVPKREYEPVLHDLSMGRYFPGSELLLPYFYDSLQSPLEFLPRSTIIWVVDKMACQQSLDSLMISLREEALSGIGSPIYSPVEGFFQTDFETLVKTPQAPHVVQTYALKVDDLLEGGAHIAQIDYSVAKNSEFRASVHGKALKGEDSIDEAVRRIRLLISQNLKCVLSCTTNSQAQRLKYLLEKHGLSTSTWPHSESPDPLTILADDFPGDDVLIVIRSLSEGFRLPEERLVFLTEEDFFTKKEVRSERRRTQAPVSATLLDFGDLKSGDYIVHIQHGIGIFDGLKVMSVAGVDAEFLQLTYKDNDRLYLPVYRIGQIQKFTGAPSLDKLGGTSWQKTKIKVRSHLRDLASELLQLYAKRSELTRAPIPPPSENFRRFEALFPYDETDDQLKSIDDVYDDLVEKKRPMDRLVCGDVGFGKTEVAMRAAYQVAEAGHQVAVLVPTTVLSFQHLENFRKRFATFGMTIAGLSRFTSKSDLKKSLDGIKDGSVNIAIGTHRLLSKDVAFKNLGLLIVDEEQKFGVVHKERIKKLKLGVDTLTLSATPIPRTLNLSLVGIRDLSLINTAPRDRLPIRTYVCKFEQATVRKAILSEIQRGGQIYYLHNRVQSIYSLADELRALVPEARIRVGHGQMAEGELEETMIAFYKHEFDVLLCTTIIESGVDVSRANTMIVDRADTFGLSQLYQLRGRIGRGKERAYCYLLIPQTGRLDPEAQERLRVLQENTMLGSGFRIAHHDLELRGAGNILGDEQSGHINAVGYELFLELLDEALREVRGEEIEDKEIEPDINLRIPALIPDSYMPDIRMRLSFYKQLTNIRGPEDLDRIESDLRDQFGTPPEQVMNLLGVMLIRRSCKDLGVRDISAGPKSVSLAFTERTKVEPRVVIDLAMREKKRYSITPDSRLVIKFEQITWPAIFEELERLKKLARLI